MTGTEPTLAAACPSNGSSGRERLVRWLYRRYGHSASYWLVMALAQGGASTLVACTTVTLAASFFDPPLWKLVITLVVEAVFTLTAVFLLASEVRPRLEQFRHWALIPEPYPFETAEVWSLVVNGTADTYKHWAWRTVGLSVLPMVVLSATFWHIGWQGIGAELIATAVPAYYATAVSYTISELLTRPMAQEIATRDPDVAVYAPGMSLVRRLRVAVPAYTTAAAMLTVGVLGFAHGPRALVLTTVAALAIGLVLSVELTALLKDSVTVPMQRLQQQLEEVRAGNYAVRAAVLSSDEFGQLADDINTMTKGLAEREAIRDAFETYLDRSIGELILSGKVPNDGFEVTATVMFCDIRGFTPWAATREARDVVSGLNDVFATIVPLINDHGGHVDKFLGDGLLAVFGTPEQYADHADRAVDAAQAIAAAMNHIPDGLRIACGINTGSIVAGPLGGAGRLNFSVIGDPVNIAARVEATTRKTGDDVLITAATQAALLRRRTLLSRGSFELKGAPAPVVLFAVPDSSDRTETATPPR